MANGFLRLSLGPLVGSALLLGACSQIIGISDYDIDPSLDPPQDGGSSTGGAKGSGAEGGASEGGGGVMPNAGETGAEGGSSSGTGGARGGTGGTGEAGAPDPGMGGAETGNCPQSCDDEIDCTVDTCNAQGTCVHTPESSLCDTDPGECVTCQAGIGCVAAQQQVVQLLLDPNFDDQSLAWEEIIFDHPLQNAIINQDAGAHSPPRSAWWMATEVDATIQGYADLLQYVTIPANTRALTVSGYYQMYEGLADPAADYVQAGLYEPNGVAALLTFHEWTGDDPLTTGWTPFEYEAPDNRLSSVVGEEVTFDLFGETWDTEFHFDSLKLEATVCE